MTTSDRVRAIIADNLGTELDQTTEAKNLCDDLGADSLDVVEVCMAVEEDLHVTITDHDASMCATVGDWVRLADVLLAAKQA